MCLNHQSLTATYLFRMAHPLEACPHGVLGKRKCRVCRRALSKKWRNANPDKNRADALKRKFGITPEQYAGMLEKQNGGCSICGRPPKTIRLGVDHDHRAEKQGIMRVRGLLCSICNRLIVGIIEKYRVAPEAVVKHLRAAPVFEFPWPVKK